MSTPKTHRDRARRNEACGGRSFRRSPGSHKGWGKKVIRKARRRADRTAIASQIEGA